jgi:predicted dienelactone hydrolase
MRLTLPPTTGPHPIGTVSLHLVDRSRRGPWLSASRPSELMVSIWYPALDDSRYQRAPWTPPAAGTPATPWHRSDEFLRFLKKMRRLGHASPAAHIGACMRMMAVALR